MSRKILAALVAAAVLPVAAQNAGTQPVPAKEPAKVQKADGKNAADAKEAPKKTAAKAGKKVAKKKGAPKKVT
jgi:hypothetical protein